MTKQTTFTAAALSIATAAALTIGSAPSALAAEKLTLTHPFSKALIYTKSCIAFANSVAKRTGGEVEVTVRGGPEAIKTFQQAPAVRDGIIDMTCVPAAFYAAAVPENEAISTSNSSPAAVRANGGMAIIDQLHQKHYKAKYLGWLDSGVNFHIYFNNPPKFKADGMPDFAGVKLRDNPIYGAFFRAMGATTHNMGFSEVFSALEKGTVNASAWTAIGVKQLKWDKFLRHRLDPSFYQSDIGLIMNNARFNKMSAKAQAALQKAVIEHENESRKARMAEVTEEQSLLAKEGMKTWTVKGAAADRYRKVSIDSAYSRMEGRLKKMNRPLDSAKKLRSLYLQ